MRQAVKNDLELIINATNPIVYVNHFDEHLFDELIADLKEHRTILEFNNALGHVDFEGKTTIDGREYSLEEFLKMAIDEAFFEKDSFILLKDIHGELENPKGLALLKKMVSMLLYKDLDYTSTIFIFSSKLVIPREIENYITIFELPPPSSEDIAQFMNNFKNDNELEIDEQIFDEIALALKGLNEFQINRILTIAYQDGGSIEAEDKNLILKEKEQVLKKSGMLEMINFKESIDDIGGLEILKNWLNQKAKVFSNLDKALKFGVTPPNGIMIVGMPGCGKSLTAKATASLFEIPLVRLDVGRLLGKYVGESEENMRKALKLAEDISPCVLWIDEIEKAFSGIGNGSEVTTRLFGQFLTWMQEKDSSVFIVATANDISKIPPEFLRKGRFDELFFVDLPNKNERKKIIEIHLKKKKKFNTDIDLNKLVSETKGYSGADLEAIIKETIEAVFVAGGQSVSTEDLTKVITNTKSISKSLGDKIENIKNTIKDMDIKSASDK